MKQRAKSTAALAAAEKTSVIINRRQELDVIRESIYSAGNSLRVVLVRGPQGAEAHNEPEGGYGKTRLLQEVFDRAQSDGEWATGNAAVSDLIDLIDIRLHAQSSFLYAVRDSFLGRADFGQYEDNYNEYRRLLSKGADFHVVREAAKKADWAFLADYAANAAEQRLVWLLDTIEQLAVVSSEWLLKRGLLTAADMSSRAFQWLQDQIEQGTLPNTTLICAGRGRQGRLFFDEIAKVAQLRHGTQAVVNVHVEPFDVEDTRRYFSVLAQSLSKAVEKSTEPDAASQRLLSALTDLSEPQSERARTVWLYTGGVPIRLALYAQIAAEGRTIPKPLQSKWDKAVAEAGTKDPKEPTANLERYQWQIEDGFIDLLFNPADTTDTRYRILQTLIRARRGLTAEQLHYVLDNTQQLPPEEWEPLAERKRIREIDDLIGQMEKLFLVKQRPSWWQLLDPAGPQPGAERCGLQDEVYRIYAEHMGLAAEEWQDQRQRRIWEHPDTDRKRYKINLRFEREARQRLYAQLRDWARYQKEKIQKTRRAYQEEDERRLRIANTLGTSEITFPALSESERLSRIIILEAERELELERLYYAMSLNPELGFNEEYSDLANEWVRAYQEESEFLAQAEVWRVLMDNDTLRFVEFVPRQTMFERHETPVQVLRRAALQEDASRWIKRFTLRNEYDRAIQFARDVEATIDQLQYGSEQDQKDWASWMHTYARGDRLCWRKYAQILLGQDTIEAIQSLETMVKDLEVLAEKTQQETAITAGQSLARRDEQGFKGIYSLEGTSVQLADHPAYLPLKRVISYTYNTIGYAYVSFGQLRKGTECYGKALYYIREIGALFHRANVLNNLSRVLSDMGRERAARVCRDGLELQRQLGEDIPIALSHNTLALIYNDRGRPEDAWPEASKAVAYFRRSEEQRGLGLALLQLGEALRRMAAQSRVGRVFALNTDGLLSAASEALQEAHQLFAPLDSHSEDSARRRDLKEPVRFIEAKIEWGCLYRDRIRATNEDKLSSQWGARYREAINHLKTAADMARERGYRRHEIDALVNIAWTHCYADKLDEALSAADEVLEQLHTRNSQCFIRAKSSDEPAGYIPDPRQEDELYLFSQLSKLYNLKGVIAHRHFRQRTNEIEGAHPGDVLRAKRQYMVQHDPIAQKHLAELAEDYTLGTAYAQLYSPRSSALSMIYDRLYDFLKKFNGSELDAFHQYINQQRIHYPMDRVGAHVEDLGNMDQFVHEVFGLVTDARK
jgi:tetratricopeptide (TPR) repeat protein